MLTRYLLIGLVTALAAIEPLFAQAKIEERKQGDWNVDVKTWIAPLGFQDHSRGEILAVEEGSVQIRCGILKGEGNLQIHRIYPINLLADGKIVDKVTSSHTYRWSDIQKGDYVSLQTLRDDGEGRHYCFGVCIARRPGAKLPESQKPKDDRRYPRDRLLNDIANGEDVSDDDIAKVYPMIVIEKTKRVVEPGGLPTEWQIKLDAIREKKEKELKTKPAPAKPDDKPQTDPMKK